MSPHDPFGRASGPPPGFSRADRVDFLGVFVREMMAGRMPPRHVVLFVCGGMDGWLIEGGDLLRDFWRVKGQQGSTATAPRIWRALCEERQDDAEPAESANPNSRATE